MAGMTTNVALVLMQCADDEFTALEPCFETFEKVVGHLKLNAATIGKQMTYYILNMGTAEDKAKLSIPSNLAELVCMVGYSILQSYRGTATEVLYDAIQHREGRPKPGKLKRSFLPTNSLLCTNAFSDNVKKIMVSSKYDDGLDVFTTALRDIAQIKAAVIRTWLVVACQTYADVMELLGPVGQASAVESVRAALHSARDTTECLVKNWEQKKATASPNHEDDLRPFESDWHSTFDRATNKALKLLGVSTKAYDRGDCYSPKWKEEQTLSEQAKNTYVNGSERDLPLRAALRTV